MRWLLLILVIKAVLLGLIVAFSGIGLSPDEAQYWTWSQELDWGYYSKPPGIAWQIGMTTGLVGNHALGVRLGALVVGFLISLAVYGVARGSGLEKRTAVWAGIVAAVCPLGVYLSFAATTDGGAILFLTLAAAAVVRGPHYLLAGVCILLGGLFKWTVFIFWPVMLPFIFFFKGMRKWSFLGGLAISLLAFVPSVYWNMSHDWATFKHVGTAVSHVKEGNFFEFLGAQMALLSPIYFVLLAMSYFYIKERRQLWIGAAFPAVVLLYLGLAFFKKMQPNWAAFLYMPGMMLIPWVALEKIKKGKIWLSIGTGLAVLMVVGAFLIPSLPVNYKLNPFRQSMGWNKLASVLEESGYRPESDFLFADKYQNVSLLSFYSQGQKRAYYFNISNTRKTQFSYWPQMQELEKGKTGYFVVLENASEKDIPWYVTHYREKLGPYFSLISYRGAFPLYSVKGVPVKYAVIFECIDYSGEAPPELNKY